MQPSNGPNPSYDFILKDPPVPKRSLLPKNPIVLVAGVVVLLLLLVLVYGIVSGGKGKTNSTGLADILGRSQEISRISQAQQANLKDPSVAALAATTQVAAASQQAQVGKFLANHNVKVDKNKLAAYAANDKSIDSQLSTAAQNNTLDSAYLGYLKTSLSAYSQALQATYNTTKSTDGKAILRSSFDSTQTLLSTPALK